MMGRRTAGLCALDRSFSSLFVQFFGFRPERAGIVAAPALWQEAGLYEPAALELVVARPGLVAVLVFCFSKKFAAAVHYMFSVRLCLGSV